jgi:enamine deaminase RidA (YjgF/YER057c/UK114 family)
MSEHLKFVQPEHFARARGYANGVWTDGPLIHVGGQIGWNAQQEFQTDDFVEQFAQTLDNVLAVVGAGGGKPGDIASMTVYVTDLNAYREAALSKKLGEVWRARLGKHYPAMALVGVAGLVEPRAQVEIQAVAVLPRRSATQSATGEAP